MLANVLINIKQHFYINTKSEIFVPIVSLTTH